MKAHKTVGKETTGTPVCGRECFMWETILRCTWKLEVESGSKLHVFLVLGVAGGTPRLRSPQRLACHVHPANRGRAWGRHS